MRAAGENETVLSRDRSDEPELPDEIEPRWPGTVTQSSASKLAHLFGVVSWGAAATTWLAKTLNSHPDILCVHACNTPLTKLSPRIRIDGMNYAALLLRLGADYEVVGDVHGFSRYDASALKEAFGPRFSSAVLVREPMERLRSQLAFFQRKEPNVGDLSYLDPILEDVGLVVSGADARLFIHAVNMLNAIVDEREVGPIYRSEDVTSRPDLFSAFIRHLSGGRIEPERDWVKTALGVPPVNVHKERSELTDWQLEVLKKVVRPRTWELYEELGYQRPPSLS